MPIFSYFPSFDKKSTLSLPIVHSWYVVTESFVGIPCVHTGNGEKMWLEPNQIAGKSAGATFTIFSFFFVLYTKYVFLEMKMINNDYGLFYI